MSEKKIEFVTVVDRDGRHWSHLADAWDIERERALTSATEHFAATWLELLPSLPDAYACHMTCAEANAAADLYRAYGDWETALAIITAHAEHDEDGDAHYASAGLDAAAAVTGSEGAS